jgi:hypothetical protein
LAIRKRFTCDGGKHHVFLMPPIQKFLFHDFVVLDCFSIRHPSALVAWVITHLSSRWPH